MPRGPRKLAIESVHWASPTMAGYTCCIDSSPELDSRMRLHERSGWRSATIATVSGRCFWRCCILCCSGWTASRRPNCFARTASFNIRLDCQVIPMPLACGVPASGRADSSSKAARFARPLSSPVDGSSPAALASHLRCGFHGARGLRQTGASTHRLQPRQARATILPSAALLRGPEPRLLARGAAARRRPYRQRRPRPSQSLLRQDSFEREDRL